MPKISFLTVLFFTAAIFGAGCLSMSVSSNGGNTEYPGANMNIDSDSLQGRTFIQNLPKDFEMPTDDAGRLLLTEYGAVFVARGGVKPPNKVVFRDEEDVSAFQERVGSKSTKIGTTTVTLQPAALDALVDAGKKARSQGLSISPRGADSARRGYGQTVSLWASRVNPGLVHWQSKGKITKQQADEIRALSAFEQVPIILGLEKQGIYFAKDLSKSIIYSVAPPGSSQHLAMLAFDVAEFNDSRVRAILNEHGWFQTVVSDLPHFTFLGVPENQLPGLGLKRVMNSGRTFWVPEL
jgi:hypothetical protein